MNEPWITILLWVALLAIFGTHYLLARLGAPTWTGAIIPVALIAACVVFAINGQLSSLRDYLMPAIGFFGLLGVWGAGRNHHKNKSSNNE